MDQCTHEVRKQHWKDIITQCNQRPEGQTARVWLDAHGICKQTFYRWQRLIRREIFDQSAPVSRALPALENTEVFFTEIPVLTQVAAIQTADSLPAESSTVPAVVIKQLHVRLRSLIRYPVLSWLRFCRR